MAEAFVEIDASVPQNSCHREGSIPLVSMLENLVGLDLERQVEAERME